MSSARDATKSRRGRGASGSNLTFLAGGGEMGARMRALDWTATPLGAPEQWPQSLKTIVRVMLDSRYAMWMLWGPELTFFCNDAYLPTVGIKADWVLGARSDKVWEEIWSDIEARITQVLKHGQATWDEGLMLFLERSGYREETYHTFSYSPVYNDESRISGMLCVVTEVTDRVIGERRLQILRDLAARPIGVQGIEQNCEHLCETLAQYPLDVPFASLYLIDQTEGPARRVARTGELPSHLLPEELALTDSLWPLATLLKSGATQELQHLPSVGIDIPAGPWPDLVQRALILPLKASGRDGLVGFLIVGISPRRPLDNAYRSFLNLVAGQIATAIADTQAFEVQRQRAEALAEIDRAKTAFFSNVSHEFRTPLTLLLGPVEESIADPQLPAAARERLLLAQRNALRLLRLVNTLLDFSRIEAGRAQASYEPTDLAAYTADLASSFRSAIERAGLKFQVSCDVLAEPVYVDREMWEKIVLNLLSNAFKFTFEGAIGVRLTHHQGAALLEVSDSGVGVASEEIPRLFERFHRIEGTQARTHEGSGIGLALVHELVRLHGGGIEVTSTPGRGSTFRVRLPLGSAHLPAERIKAPRAVASMATGSQAFVQEALRWLPEPATDNTTSLQALPDAAAGTPIDQRFASTFGARIVLADDNADMRAYVTELLAPTYSVEAVGDGEQAFRAARRARPDLIISDVMMPRLDGFGLVAAVRADPSLSSVPIVMLSARAGEEARIEGLDAGADDYLIKPFSARELVARVGALLELGHIRRQTEEALRRRSAQFQTLLNQAPLGVYLVDAELKVREINPVAQKNFGGQEDLRGSDYDELVHRRWGRRAADEMVQRIRDTLASGAPYIAAESAEQRLDRPGTEYYEWQMHRTTLPDGGFGVMCYFRDISAHVQARAALESADRQKDEFLAMLAHELRNPLAPLRNASELLAATAREEPRVQFTADVIRRQVTQLTRLVDDLLDISRITEGRIELNRESLELGDIVAQALETVEPLLCDKRHKVSIVRSDRQLYVDGDNARLVQCVSNILTNAAKYTDADGQIGVRTYAEGSRAIIEVSDNGVGIAPELQPRIFELFVQGDRSLDRSQGGLGIGLSVVKRLVEMHGGHVMARSEGIGRGSIFQMSLPASKPPGIAARGAPKVKDVPKRILIVDDNADAADSLAMLLQLDGHETLAVYGSAEAIKQAQEFRPDVMLLDIGLPEMNGYEVARRVRSHPEFQHIRLIAVTGYGQEADRARAQQSGFDGHLVKPVEPQALTQALADSGRSV
ncbi:MAG TPA: ATP-binding protein [Steroidobacteraceae bacterium]|jgi:signal transduction histidine kinase